MTSSLRARARVRAPELAGAGGWLNTQRGLSLAELRGKIVVLDFWTFCCINCLHVIDELRPIEEKYPDEVVIIGVHSPKFVHEADHEAVRAAVERYEVHHPVLDDPGMATWNAYAVRAWPTLVVIDPEGYVVAQMSGEGHAHNLGVLLGELIEEHDAKGTLRRGDGPFVARGVSDTPLRFPGKAVALPGGSVLVSDSKHHSIVELAEDGETVLRRIGTGDRGLVDGASDVAEFAEPQGLLLLPPHIVAAVGYEVLVADTANHVLRGLRRSDGAVTTVAGSGRQWMQGSGTEDLSSPWDLAWFDGRVVVAMAGIHQLWSFDPVTGLVGIYAGTTNEGLRDGPLEQAWFAQTSGLATSADGETLWLADSETSALRYLRDGEVHTAVGTGLFDFGHRDGDAADALFQHPLGVATLPDGSVGILDTYNGAVRRYDPGTRRVTTLATGLHEPSDALVVGDDLLVVESAAHRLLRLRLPQEALEIDGAAHRTRRPETELSPGDVELRVVFEPPTGQKLDERYGPATRLIVSATPPGLLRAGDGSGTGLARRLVIDQHVGDGVLHIAAMAASCDDDVSTQFPACHVHQQDWGVPVRVTSEGLPRLTLVLLGQQA